MSAMNPDLSALAIEGALRFEDSAVGPRVLIDSDACEAEIYLYGAQVTRFRPRGARELLFLSPRSTFVAGKAIRGGVPIVFPWFGDRSEGGPAHGFARITSWSLLRTAKSERGVELVLQLSSSDASRALGFDDFSVEARIVAGPALEIALLIENRRAQPLSCEAALHSYLAVDDIARVEVDGLAGTHYVDKADHGQRKQTREPRMGFTGEVDQMHFDAGARHIVYQDGKPLALVEQAGADATVIWNPGQAKGRAMRDLSDGTDDAWRRFVCVEAAAAADHRLRIAPHATHRLATRISAAS